MSARLNVYICGLDHETVTIDRDEGVTPMLLRCRVLGCREMARSSFYRCPPGRTPTHEWYKPSAAEVAAMPRDHRYHYEQGGLAIRAISLELTPDQLAAAHAWMAERAAEDARSRAAALQQLEAHRTALCSGAAARKAGGRIWANPHVIGQPEFDLWRRGYLRAAFGTWQEPEPDALV